MDECYTYYGVWHESFGEFYTSMLTGINFSPPLFFFLNFLIQLFFPTSIELLRIQSLIWILVGITISFLLARKTYGLIPAFLATIFVLSQSNLLISQSLEARHYSMFFACGAWVLYMLKKSSNQPNNLRNKVLIYLSHLCISQIHYLGIIFSGLAGLAHLICSKRQNLVKRIPIEIWLAWISAVPFLLFFLGRQESVLNYWPKPNEFNDLLNTYNESFIFLSVLFSTSLALFIKNKSSVKAIGHVKILKDNNIVATTLILWILAPLIFWSISHISDLNLFVDRYFIPKEAAIILITASFFNFILDKVKVQKVNFVCISSLILCFVCIGLNFKRFAHNMDPEHNFHHKLIIQKSYEEEQNKIFIYKDDSSYFPNAYIDKNMCAIEITNQKKREIYKNFSKNITIK